jgi:hypothetical protein
MDTVAECTTLVLLQAMNMYVAGLVVVMGRRSGAHTHRLFFTPRFEELAPSCHSLLVHQPCTHGIVLGIRRHRFVDRS